MQVKRLLSALLLLLPSVVFAEQPVQWHLLGTEKINGISGISGIDEEHFLVVHDRKKPNEPRLSVVTWKKGEKPFLTRREWCDNDNFPVDLEAVTAIPNYPKEYLVLESKGEVTRIQLGEDSSCKVLEEFELPTATDKSNMEGLALYCFGEDCVLSWAERGDDKTPAKLFWASFDIKDNDLDSPETEPFEFKAPYPEANHHRSISELAVDATGNLWASSISDPSDVGTFRSAIYNLGSFTHSENKIAWNPVKNAMPFARYEKDNVKIEGLFFTTNGLIMASEDEVLGGRIALNPLK
jgi:hypothetical protein